MILKVEFLTLFKITIVLAHYHHAYFHSDNDAFVSYPNWMELHTHDDWMLSELALPGTHASATFTAFMPYVKVQAIDFYQQLIYGIRVFDIRYRHTSNGFALHHGEFFLNVMFGDFLNNVTRFLRQYPSETVLFRLREEYEEDNNNGRSQLETLQEYLNGYEGQYVKTDKDISIGQARGKFIILVDHLAFNGYGLNYRSFEIQDKYKVPTNWDLYSKWEAVKRHLSKSSYGDKSKFYVNYLSGSEIALPYFVASGHFLPGTSDDRLWTGRIVNERNSDLYPDFPRKSCFLGLCSVYFEGTNILTYDFIYFIKLWPVLGLPVKRTVGIIMADFPGSGLINEIIMNNRVKIAEKSSLDSRHHSIWI